MKKKTRLISKQRSPSTINAGHIHVHISIVLHSILVILVHGISHHHFQGFLYLLIQYPFFTAIMGFRIAAILVVLLLGWIYKSFIQPPKPKLCGTPNGPPITSPRIQLRDGRHLSYKESGVPKEKAKYKIILIHGFFSTKETTIDASQVSGNKFSTLKSFLMIIL